MWLSFSAAFIGVFYALVKFLVVYHFRRLNNDTISAQHTLQKKQLHLDAFGQKTKNPLINKAHDQTQNQRPQQTDQPIARPS